jgi:hypothetical protein
MKRSNYLKASSSSSLVLKCEKIKIKNKFLKLVINCHAAMRVETDLGAVVASPKF